MEKKKRGGGIVKISNLFKKYTVLLKAPQKTVINCFIEVVEELFGFTLRGDQCAYSVASQTMTLRISGTIKTEIILQKKEITERMTERLGGKEVIKKIL